MHFALTEEQAAIQETALTFAKERIAPQAAEWDEKCHFPVDVIRETAALGMAAIYVPAVAYEIARGVTWTKILLLIVNVCIVAYLAYVLWRSKRSRIEQQKKGA